MRHAAALLVALCLGSLPGWAQNETRPAGDGRISGRVLAESGAPIADATVFAVLFTGQAQATARYVASSGPDGGYFIARLPSGRFRVHAEKAGYSNDIVQPGQMESGRLLDLAPAGAVSGIDLVLRRTGTITGRVTRPDGTPVATARVVSQIRLSSGRMLGTGPGVVTDTDGRYRLGGVPPGTYVVTAIYSVLHENIGKPSRDEYQDWARTFHPATTEFERATPLTIRGGERLEQINITLQPEHRYRISGLVTAQDGATLRNIRVEFSSESGMSGIHTVREDGRFTIGGVRGPVTLLATADTEKGAVIGLAQVNATGSLDGVGVVVGRPARVSGRITFEGAPPPLESPLEVQLATDWSRPRPGNDTPDTVAVGVDGRFAIDNVIGMRRVTVLRLPPPWDIKEVRHTGRVLPDGRLTLDPGQTLDDVEIVIARRE